MAIGRIIRTSFNVIFCLSFLYRLTLSAKRKATVKRYAKISIAFVTVSETFISKNENPIIRAYVVAAKYAFRLCVVAEVSTFIIPFIY